MCELKSCDSNHLKGGHPDDPEYPFVKEFFLDFYQIENKKFERNLLALRLHV